MAEEPVCLRCGEADDYLPCGYCESCFIILRGTPKEALRQIAKANQDHSPQRPKPAVHP